MTDPIRLSVIIPVYNAARWLPQCIRSVQSQGIENMELLCVDDGSSDNSLEALSRLAEEDARIRVVSQENASAGAARNRGLDMARGEYVHFLDADDWLFDGLYGKLLPKMDESGADMAVFPFSTWDEREKKDSLLTGLLDGRERITSFAEEPAFFLYANVVPWNKLYRRAWLQKHGLRFDAIHCANDRGFYFRSLAAEPTVLVSHVCGVHYRIKASESALTGGTRYRHLDCLFTAWEGAQKAFSRQPEERQAMLLDATVLDFLDVLDKTPPEDKADVESRLGEYLRGTELSVLQSLPIPCLWTEEERRLRAGETDWHTGAPPVSRRKKYARGLRIWSLGFYLRKLFCR